jgi:hypothetical protein
MAVALAAAKASMTLLKNDKITLPLSKSSFTKAGSHGARFSAEIYTRGCHWIPRMFASSIPLESSLLLPVHTVICVQILKACAGRAASKHGWVADGQLRRVGFKRQLGNQCCTVRVF